MNRKKLLALLVIFTVYINYKNYIEEDTDKLKNQIAYTQNKVEIEKSLNDRIKEIDYNHLETKNYKSLMYDGKGLSYSESMGKFQETIEQSAESLCKNVGIKWSEIPRNDEEWYDILSLYVSLECTMRDFIEFQNKLNSQKRIVYFRQLRLSKSRKGNFLNIATEAVSFRVKE